MWLAIKPGLARLVTVAHYLLGAIFALFFALTALNGAARSWFAPLSGLYIYYGLLEVSTVGKWVGDQFMKRPLLMSIELLWADLNVAALLGGLFLGIVTRPPAEWAVLIVTQWFLGAIAAAVILRTADWVARGFLDK